MLLLSDASCVPTAYVDSNSEDSDSDLSDVPEVDSDLEREKQKSYSRAVYKEDELILQKKVKADLNDCPRVKRKDAPQEGLQLFFVHG